MKRSLDEGEQASDEDLIVNTAKRSKPLRSLLAETLPCAENYEISYMHRDVVSHVVVARSSEFILTGSTDGHIKFWRKMQSSIEFVKHFQAHLGPLHSLVVSADDRRLLTTSADQMIKIFDILIFDMASMIDVDYVPTAAAWLSSSKIAVADRNAGTIRIYRTDGAESNTCIHTISGMHLHPVVCLEVNLVHSCVVSADNKGGIEYWDCAAYQPLAASNSAAVSYEFKSETDLYELAKHKTEPLSISCSKDGTKMLLLSRDRQIRLFDFRTAKLKRRYDESVKMYTELIGNATEKTEMHDLIRRKLEMEMEMDSTWDTATEQANALFDATGKFIIYSSLIGIKIIDTESNDVVKVVGKAEKDDRFLHIALYQGHPKVDMQFLLSQGKGNSKTTMDEMHSGAIPDPTLFACSFKKRRFYCLSRREPEDAGTRDRLNETPTADDVKAALEKQLAKQKEGQEKHVILRTSLGDIHIKLFPEDCPKTIENFVTHCKNGYYDGVKFHRVIRGFMVQTGDPLGDGTGGESCWGGDFEDEFCQHLKHNLPYTVSMANAGPNTNGSQFFITTAATPHLDQKHTVFGRVTSGFDVVTHIEGVKVDKHDAPLKDVKILSVDFHS